MTKITTETPLKEGDKLKVVSDSLTRKYGISGQNLWNRFDVYIAPGEIGTVTRSTYTANDGSAMAHWTLEFERGRRLTLDTPRDVRSVEATYALFFYEREAEKFRRVPKRRQPTTNKLSSTVV